MEDFSTAFSFNWFPFSVGLNMCLAKLVLGFSFKTCICGLCCNLHVFTNSLLFQDGGLIVSTCSGIILW